MTAGRLKAEILSLTNDIVFTYEGKIGGIFPISRKQISIGWNNEAYDFENENGCIDEVMNAKIFDGRSLAEIAEELDI